MCFRLCIADLKKRSLRNSAPIIHFGLKNHDLIISVVRTSLNVNNPHSMAKIGSRVLLNTKRGTVGTDRT